MTEFRLDIVPGGEPVDIMPLVLEAMSNCAYKHDLSALEIAEYIALYGSGKRIPVAVLDRVEDRMLDALIGPVVKRVYSMHRIKQISDVGLQRLRPYTELASFDPDEICGQALHMVGRWLQLEELRPLPLPGCKNYRCSCSYLTLSKRDLRRRAESAWTKPPDK